MRIYFDVCCLSRPFDVQLQERVRLETEAILAIAHLVEEKRFELVSSIAVELETQYILDDEKRKSVRVFANQATIYVPMDEWIEKRATSLLQLQFKEMDSLHIACGERANVELFFTTDDGLLRTASKHKKLLNITIANPVEWFMKERNNGN